MNISKLILWLIIACLSSLRLTELMHDEDGPYDIIERLREFLGVEYFDDLTQLEQNEIIENLQLTNEDELPLYNVNTMIGKLFDCIRCLSIWSSFIHAVILYRKIRFPAIFIPIITLAISTVVIKSHDT